MADCVTTGLKCAQCYRPFVVGETAWVQDWTKHTTKGTRAVRTVVQRLICSECCKDPS